MGAAAAGAVVAGHHRTLQTSPGRSPCSPLRFPPACRSVRDAPENTHEFGLHDLPAGNGEKDMSHVSLTKDLHHAARRARGKQAGSTRKARDQALARFARYLWDAGFQIHTTGQVREKHIRAWVADLRGRGRTARTVANSLAHVRTALEGIGRRAFADRLANAQLGVAGASRAGTKAPLAPEQFEAFLAAARAKDPGVAMVLELQREFGLRAQEGVRSVDSLADWERVLASAGGDGFVLVIHGTKGGRTRRSPPQDRARALDVVRRARAMCRGSGGKLVRKPDLKTAMQRYSNVTRRIGMEGAQAPHCLRYTYAVEHLLRMKAEGLSRGEAVAAVSTYLGHGDGRGRYVEQVYGQALC